MIVNTTKRVLTLIFSILLLSSVSAQSAKTAVEIQPNKAFKDGEYLKYRIHFSVLNAGFATLKLTSSKRNGQDLYHAVGKGWTTGAAKMFYVVHDTYESYFTKGVIKPVFHKRRVDEDGYLIRRDKYFDNDNNIVTVDDLQKNTKKTYPIQNVQDMVSSLYYMRDVDISNMKEGGEISVNLFFDGETFPFKLKFLKKETINTKFGKVRTWRVQPMVQKGRVFENEESLTIWITDDLNKIPIRIKASLVLGSLKADLDAYSGLANSFQIVMD